MTQTEINNFFKSVNGKQCTMAYTTSDDNIFHQDDYEEAEKYVDSHELQNKFIRIWYNPYLQSVDLSHRFNDNDLDDLPLN
ncbi:hypothetical protein BH23BAC1_BH23BAC1_27070 [soil metagenome]